MDRNRRGSFVVNNIILKDPTNDKALIDLIFSKMIITQVQANFMLDGVEYYAYSDEFFAECPVGQITPNYQFEISRENYGRNENSDEIWCYGVKCYMDDDLISDAEQVYTLDELSAKK